MNLLGDAQPALLTGITAGGFRLLQPGLPGAWADLCITGGDVEQLQHLATLVRPRWILRVTGLAELVEEYEFPAGYRAVVIDHPGSGLRITVADRLAAPALEALPSEVSIESFAALLVRALASRPCSFCALPPPQGLDLAA